MKKYFLLGSLFVLPAGSMLYFFNDGFRKYFSYSNLIKDETRFNSVDYGLSWGSRTDEIVNLSKIDRIKI
jgi:hypothetical protein